MNEPKAGFIKRLVRFHLSAVGRKGDYSRNNATFNFDFRNIRTPRDDDSVAY